jgi:uncharacterized protein involved in outer membrane biogenesis
MNGRVAGSPLASFQTGPEARSVRQQPQRASAARGALRILVTLAVAAVIAACVMFAAIPILADHLREPIAGYFSGQLARPVAIKGSLSIEPALPLLIRASDIVIGSGSKEGGPDLLRVERLELELEVSPLLHRRIVIPRARVFGPTLTLEKDAEGRVNWRRSKPRTHPPHPPEIGSLQIADGRVIYRDAILAVEAELALESDAQPQSRNESALRFNGAGTVAKMPFQLEGEAGNPLSLIQPGTAYNVDAMATAHNATASFSGTLVPLDWNSTDGRFVLNGNDLSRVVNIASLHKTPSYHLTGHLARRDAAWLFDDLRLKVGRSDLSGKVTLKRVENRPTIVADIRSEQLDLGDIGVLAGSRKPNPSHFTAPARTDAQPASESDAKVLPARPYNPKRLRRSDVDLQFRGKRVLVRKIELQRVTTHIALERGQLRFSPLQFDLAGGHVSSRLSLDARNDPIQSVLEISAHDVEVMALLPALASQHGSEGRMSGNAALRSSGNSVAQTMASASGTVDLHVSEGRVNALALVLADLDLGKAAELVLFGDKQAQVNCMAASADIKNGTLFTSHLVVDSSEANIVGAGRIDFRDERYDLRVKADAKHASIAKLRGPIVIEGSFRHPKVHPEVAPIAGRAAASVALGVLVTPLAALLPLIDLGNAKGSGCAALAAEMAKRHPSP